MNCINCGCSVGETDKFCANCGSTLSKALIKWVDTSNNKAVYKTETEDKPLSHTEYNLFGQTVFFPDIVLDTGYMLKHFLTWEAHYINILREKYSKCKKPEEFLRQADEVFCEAETIFSTYTISGLSKIMEVNKFEIRKMFGLPEEIKEVYDYFAMLNSSYTEYTPYTPRSRWVGGGFGIVGAAKGAITAGAFNAVGNFMSSIRQAAKVGSYNAKIDVEKSRLYRNKGFINTFEYGIEHLSRIAEVVFKNELIKFYGYDAYEKIDYVKALNTYCDMLDGTLATNATHIVKAIQLCPYMSDAYMYALEKLNENMDELGKLYKRCIQNDKFDQENNKYSEIYLNIQNGNFSKLLDNQERSLIEEKIKNTVFTDTKKDAEDIFRKAISGEDISKVPDMLAFVEIMKSHIKDPSLFCLAGKIYEDNCYGISANLNKSIVYYELAAAQKNLEAAERLAHLYYINKNKELAENWARKALKLNVNSVSAQMTLGKILHKKFKLIDACKEAIQIYTNLSNKSYSELDEFYTPVYFCYCAAKVYEENAAEMKDPNKAIEWYIKGINIAANHPNDEWVIPCCSNVLPLLRNARRYAEMVQVATRYRGKYIGADYILGYAYCRGTGVDINYNAGAACFISVLNNYNDEKHNHESYITLKRDAQTVLDKMVCKNGVWKKKLFESI